MDNIPVEWAPVIVKAWLDDEFKEKLESNPTAAFRQLNLTYEGSEAFTVPAPPLKLDFKEGEACLNEVIPNTCTRTIRINFDYEFDDKRKGAITIENLNDVSDLYVMPRSTNNVVIYKNMEKEYTLKRN